MTPVKEYALDANVFIQAANQYYAFDLAPKFWCALIIKGKTRSLFSIDKVSDELEKGDGELWDWAQNNFGFAFVSTDDDEVIKEYSKVVAWVFSQTRFTEAAKSEFASCADGWLIAFASVTGRIVVTHERPAPA